MNAARAPSIRDDEDAELAGVVSCFADAGVEMTVDVQDDGSFWLGNLARTTGPRGTGRRALDALCELADEREVAVALAVAEDCHPVVAMYVDAGFERIDEGSRGGDGFAVMRREPYA